MVANIDNELRQYIIDNYQRAFDIGYIQPYYQPVIRTISKKLCSFEALARWIDPNKGVIYPDQFISVLEDIRVIHLLDAHIIKQACLRIRKNIDENHTPIPVSINLSRLDFELCDVFKMVDDIVSKYQIPHDFLYVEITESVMGENKEKLIKIVNKFRNNGYQIWMDDFGSAYSSLNILKDFNFDEIKLDMMFLAPFNQRSKRIAAAVVEMAKNINIHTLCEGVETEEQFNFLRNIGCEKVQGYLFGKPMPYLEAIEHLKENGIGLELPNDRKYHDELGKVNFLSSVPFLTKEERDNLTSARQLNSIPLALLEVNKNNYSVLFYNTAFEETQKNTGLFSFAFSQEMLREPKEFNTVSSKFLSLLDSTHTKGQGRMNITSNNEYYEIQTKCIASNKDKYSVLMKLNNLSKDDKAYNTAHLDEYIRMIYTIYERITLIDLKNNIFVPLYVTTKDSLVKSVSALEMAKEYADKYIYIDDRKTYIELFNRDDADERFEKAQSPFITKILRTNIGHGEYRWKEYTLLRIKKDYYLILIKNVHDEVVSTRYFRDKDNASIDEKQLWHNLVNSGIIRIFWKDKDRRFLGASKSFLDYYGFPSLDSILGKNDEEIGWHIHPDKYRSDELDVIEEGITTRNVPGFCISNGENKEILASKTPLYDSNGEIQGLMGYFIDRELLSVNDVRGEEDKTRDMLTGLLNSRGLYEELNYYRDEYFLRNLDFVRIHVSINDFERFNKNYSFDFGDKVLIEVAKVFKNCLGVNSAISRITGQQFVIVSQIEDKDDARIIHDKIKEAADSIKEVDGIPVTLYLSIGYAIFSDYPDINSQAKQADMLLVTHHNLNAYIESRITKALDAFSLFDDLPLSLAVYYVPKDNNDPTIFYANHTFEKYEGHLLKDIFGKAVKEFYPNYEDTWYEDIKRAAYSDGLISGKVLGKNNQWFTYSMVKVISNGYCVAIFRKVD